MGMDPWTQFGPRRRPRSIGLLRLCEPLKTQPFDAEDRESVLTEAHHEMSPDDGVSLFIGILPGSDRRQVVLFPDGHVLADLREQDIDVGGYCGPDQGLVAASALIGVLRDHGWYVEEMTHAAAVWLKPGIAASDSASDADGEAFAGNADGYSGDPSP